ncbi:RadC family protein [Caldinitratiruptor microaerophilus]|uniref:UPF0758 protein n=1 Tax=Caldinitratiruptor microaerophilus TaxID=671077 RepID=A0AA35CPN2_9FIRM|nr:DNA repair protein RadC [Caldinitratiruptor microaerophilus]BDG61510.1 UPF0758 protein [Caldinitratiruptor microaerophilus]
MRKGVTLKSLPPSERPRERLLAQGPRALTDAELLAVLLDSGRPGVTAVEVAQELLLLGEGGGHPLDYLAEAPAEELRRVAGLGPAKIARLKAAVELGTRLWRARAARPSVRTAAEVAALLMEEMRRLDREEFRVVLLDVRGRVLGVETVSVGSLSTSVVHPREVFKGPIRRSAHSVILVHNHPSGDPTPSPEDREVTRRLAEVGRIMGIEVLDHIVIGDRQFVSLRERYGPGVLL